MLTAEEALAQLVLLTGEESWSDFLACTADQQMAIVQLYRDAAWVRNVDTFAKVLQVLALIGTVAGVVSGVAGAAGAVAALRSL